MLDTGRPSVIKGNLEFDRLTLQHYDYLNVFTYFLRNTTGRKTETTGMRVLDEVRLPLLSDAYSPSERHVGLQLFARGLPLALGSLKRFLTLQNPKEWFDEWTIGMDGESLLVELLERDLIVKLKDPRIRYVDFLIPTFDHAAHIKREPDALLHALKKIDGIVQRVWIEIEKSPFPNNTALILVSDHGMNTSPGIYSQGYNLIDLFGSAAGGGHHVVTNRPPLGAYNLKPPSPALPPVTTPSAASTYLKEQASAYPTVLLDADGNERASVYLRNSDLNILQILWQQLVKPDLSPAIRAGATQAFFAVVEKNRREWTNLLAQLQEELPALRRSPAAQAGADESKYSGYVRTLETLLLLKPENLAGPTRLRIDQIIAKNSMGRLNSIYNLQNYVVGLSSKGLVLSPDGSLDMNESFVRVNYFSLIRKLRTRNNPQKPVSSQPVDFVAVSIPVEGLKRTLPDDFFPVENAIWLFRDEDRQTLILSRRRGNDTLLRYLPVRRLMQNETGAVSLELAPLIEKLPLELWESLPMPAESRREWLQAWHTEAEWFQVIHPTTYSNALISLHEQFSFSPNLFDHRSTPLTTPLTDDDLILRFRERKRHLAQADFIVFANDHWNFNYRGFNPGGNHGAFFRSSTHSTLMFAGGEATRIPQGLEIKEAYDGLSLVPTIFTLTGKLTSEGLSEELRQKGFGPFPGPVIRELFEERTSQAR
jgi:hypothetical protein